MARHIHLDPVGGAAGDMLIAALLDAMPELREAVLAQIGAVLPPEAGAIMLAEGRNGGFRGLHFSLTGAGTAAAAGKSPGQGHQHHDHDHAPGHSHHHHHHHHGAEDGRPVTWPDFCARLADALLPEAVKVRALAILRRLGEAEAHVHGIPLEQVHFHEIADWDTLADVTGAAAIMVAAEASFSVGPLPLGGGSVVMAHGRIALPAPATMRILRGYDWHDDGIAGERVTPTGAAILAELTGGSNGARPGGRLLATGAGLGSRTLPGIGNLLRAQVFDTAGAAQTDRVLQLACDLDDMTGEEIGHAAAHLRALPGVIDLTLLATQGKKGRPVTRLELLARPEQGDVVAEALFAETSTLGLRQQMLTRRILERRATGPVKTASRPRGATSKAEADALADTPGLAARRALARRLTDDMP